MTEVDAYMEMTPMIRSEVISRVLQENGIDCRSVHRGWVSTEKLGGVYREWIFGTQLAQHPHIVIFPGAQSGWDEAWQAQIPSRILEDVAGVRDGSWSEIKESTTRDVVSALEQSTQRTINTLVDLGRGVMDAIELSRGTSEMSRARHSRRL